MDGYRIITIHDTREAERYLREIGAEELGIKLMVPKAVFRAIKIKAIPARAAGIIKQEMLAKGGEAAVNRRTITGEGETDVLLLGTLRQYQLLIDKLKLQPFGLKKLASELEQVLQGLESTPRVTLSLAGGRELVLGEKTLIMGILNVTPDSFYDGGRYCEVEAAVKRAREMVEEGADLIDLGGYSTRPGASPVSPEEEISRVIPVLKRLKQELPQIPVSVDTFVAETAQAVLEAGADIINDPGGLRADPGMASVVAEFDCPVVIMHNRLGGGYRDLVAEVIADLSDAIKLATEQGIAREQIIVDPGIGFGKTGEENLVLIRNLGELKSLGRPILLGVSNKSFIGRVTGDPTGERLIGSLAAAMAGVMNGAGMVRVHNVRETRKALMVVDAIMEA
ncbi:MAG: dihydropteroate synthase [Bacillota bacterium]